MLRTPLLAAVAVVAVVGPARAGAPAPPRTAAQKFAGSEVVVTGKVTAIEKDTVDASSAYPGAKDKVTYKVAVVKIDAALAGANGVTHLKVGFVPPAKPDPNVKPPVGRPFRPGLPPVELKEGVEMLFFLVKHPTADFYVMPVMNPSVDVKAEAGKKELEVAKTFAAVLADPVKALKGDKAEARAEAAALLVVKYRTPPEFVYDGEQVAIPAAESKLILKGLLDGAWSAQQFPASGIPSAYQTFYRLGLTKNDGWTEPAPVAGSDYGLVLKEAFAKWLDGAGKDYVVKKIVPKKK